MEVRNMHLDSERKCWSVVAGQFGSKKAGVATSFTFTRCLDSLK
jgi:hypothetical protein